MLIFSILKKKIIFAIYGLLALFQLFLINFSSLVYSYTIKSGGLFWSESVGNDLFNKVKAGQESHGFPPGYYFLIFLFFWPGSIFILNTIKNIKLNFFEILEN